MPKHLLRPQGDFPSAGPIRRFAAIFYDFLLCIALLMVVTLLYKGVQMAIYGEERLRQMSDAGALDGDPLLSTLLVMSLFGFFAKFWTHNGQTLGMQVWGLRIQNADGTAISLWQALLLDLGLILFFLPYTLAFNWLYDLGYAAWLRRTNATCRAH